MNRRGAGLSFIFIGAFLTSTKYLAAAVFASENTTWSFGIFKRMLSYIGPTLTILSIGSFIIGAIYLVNAEKKNE